MADISPTTGEQYNRVAHMRDMGRRSALNLVGRRFGRLVVLSRAGTKYRKSVWKCRCDCGSEKDILGQSLVRGSTSSCGCLHKEIWHGIIYNPDITDEDRELAVNRDLDPRNAEWRRNVYERDGYMCRVCGDDRGGNLVAHHKDAYHWCKQGRYDVDNGVTACETCHNEFHRLYGKEGNTKKQWDEYCSKNRRHKPLRIVKKKVDISGLTFGYFTVLRREGSTKDGHASFMCRCICGIEKKVVGTKLRRGEVKSCGCMKGNLISSSKRRVA